MKTRAIFLGSFDPPHNGHINCLKSVIESDILDTLNIEKINIIPSKQNPNKPTSSDFWDRYRMCVLEFSELSNWCVIDDIEKLLTRTDSNFLYTYQLINYFKSGHDDIIDPNFWWIITDETYQELKEGKWKNSEELLKHNRFIIVVPENKVEEYLINEDTSQFRKIIKLKDDPNATKHSSDLRMMLSLNQECRPWLKDGVIRYITEYNLYNVNDYKLKNKENIYEFD